MAMQAPAVARQKESWGQRLAQKATASVVLLKAEGLMPAQYWVPRIYSVAALLAQVEGTIRVERRKHSVP